MGRFFRFSGGKRLLAIFISLQLFTGCETISPFLQNPEQKQPVAKTEETQPTPKATQPAEETISQEKLAAEKLLESQRQKPTTDQPKFNQPSVQLNRPQLPEDAVAVRIAILLPLSGQHEKVGTDLLNAAKIALFDLNNTQLRLQPYDTKGTVDGARDAATSAIQEGAEIILGPLFASSVRAIQPMARQNNISILTFSTDVSVAGNGVYLLGLTVQQQISRILEFSYRQGLSKFAVLAPQTPYGETAMNSIEAESRKLGVSLTQVNRFPTDLPPGSEELQSIARSVANYEVRQANLQREINKVKDKKDPQSKALFQKLAKLDTLGEVNFEAIIIPEGGQRLRELAPLLSFYDVDPAKVQFIGTGLWADVSLTTEPSLVGGWFAAPAPGPANSFLARFNSIYGYTPPRIASLAYDAMALSGLLALDDVEQKFSKDRLESPKGFSGYNGIFRFNSSGLAERGLAVMQLGQDSLELLEAAPTTFTPAIN
ncbi:penicillin-binding protein activator [Sneathiella glossodoripedis]|uniref:penicillin-binding protein activator n=1 Tax=Sneathiella glossodoripedis TaxID=418853 RepID=UPI000471E4C3|nr:penicillin-binding protein activator [Sneathiella glossodoripedis]